MFTKAQTKKMKKPTCFLCGLLAAALPFCVGMTRLDAEEMIPEVEASESGHSAAAQNSVTAYTSPSASALGEDKIKEIDKLIKKYLDHELKVKETTESGEAILRLEDGSSITALLNPSLKQTDNKLLALPEGDKSVRYLGESYGNLVKQIGEGFVGGEQKTMLIRHVTQSFAAITEPADRDLTPFAARFPEGSVKTEVRIDQDLGLNIDAKKSGYLLGLEVYNCYQDGGTKIYLPSRYLFFLYQS